MPSWRDANERAGHAQFSSVCRALCADCSPIPLASRDAGERGIARKVRPWEMEGGNARRQFERARAAAARLINADPNEVALIPSVSYGVATAARALPLPQGVPRISSGGRSLIPGTGVDGPDGGSGRYPGSG